MTTNLDTQVHDPAAIEATEKKYPHILDDADLDAVNGGTVHDAIVRAALGVLFNNAFAGYLTGEVYRGNPCP